MDDKFFYFGTGELLPIFQNFKNTFEEFLLEWFSEDRDDGTLHLFITFQVSIIDVRFELLPWQLPDKSPSDFDLMNNEEFSNDRSPFCYARGELKINYRIKPNVEVFIPEVLKGDFPLHFTTNSASTDKSIRCFEESSELYINIGTHQHFGQTDKLYLYWSAPRISKAARYCDYLQPNGFVGYLVDSSALAPKKSNKIISITFGQAYRTEPIFG